MSDTGQSLCRDPLPCCRSPVSVIKLTRITVRQKSPWRRFLRLHAYSWSFLFFAPKRLSAGRRTPVSAFDSKLPSGRGRRHCYTYQTALSIKRSRVTCPLLDIWLASAAGKAQRDQMSNGPQRAAVDSFVSRENIRRHRKLASELTDATERSQIMKLLAEEDIKFKLELRHGGDPPEERSPLNTATDDRVEHDGDEQQGAG